jgi:sugar transferase (PEP-CTERM/EpsH1 system associated)
MAQYVDHADGIPVVMDLVDVDSDKWAQYAGFASLPWSAIYRRESRCLRQYEQRACARSWRVVVSTEREAALARQLAAHDEVYVIANGVDTQYFAPAGRPDASARTVIFVGDMSYFPNQVAVDFFAREVFPIVRKSVPAARFRIVGRNPSKKVRQLADLGAIEVTGSVPDVRPYLAQSQVSVAPFSIAAGIQNKILESMACGLPVVATSRAAQGLARQVAESVEIADEPSALAKAVVNLLSDTEAARRTGLEGRSRVAAAYNWGFWLDRLVSLIEGPAIRGEHGGPNAAQSHVLAGGTGRYHG